MTTALTVLSDRFAGVTILQGANSNIDGAQGIFYSLPAGLGDVLILDVNVRITGIDVVQAVAESGVYAAIANNGETVIYAPIGSQRWVRGDTTVGSSNLYASIDPDAPELLRESERFYLEFGEVDTDATPTADVQVLLRCQRLRIAGPTPQEFRLTS